MTLDNWTEYKKVEAGKFVSTNMVYVPLVDPSNSICCMDFGNSRITFDNTFFFLRELQYLERFKKYKWIPSILDIDKVNKRIYFEWHNGTCNNILETGQSLDTICPDWEPQLKNILNNIQEQQVYKINVYPHCFFIDSFKQMRAMDFYACVDHNDYIIPIHVVKPIIGKLSIHRWEEASDSDAVNFKTFFYNGLSKHIIWPNNVLRNWLNEQNFTEQ